MVQLHKRYSDEQVAFLFQAHVTGLISRREVQEALDIGRSQFFELLAAYRKEPQGFSLAYHRASPRRITPEAEAAIERELLRERGLVEDKELPISGYNYSAVRDRLQKQGITVSVNTIIDRAKKLDCHQPRKTRKVHDREVLTASVGALIQHDGSTHRWSPLAREKWTLITSIDDYSRKILFADFFPAESTWAHIQATQSVVETFGVPLRYYVDSLRVFRFVQGRDSFWRKHVLQTDDVDTQWGKMMNLLGVDITYALSPQAKGKVERPYRWLQDRIVRTCALEGIADLEGARHVLYEELHRYNHHQVHSTTKEIPNLRFETANAEGNSLFRPFSIPRPYTSSQDVFCLREKRTINGYRRISVLGNDIQVPGGPLFEQVDVHMVPDLTRDTMDIRIWWNGRMPHSLTLPLKGFRVHF
jgi:transposase